MAFKSGNTEQIILVNKELKREIRRGRPDYRTKLENQFKEGNAKQRWSSVREMTGFEQNNDKSRRTVDNVHDYVKDLNKFYHRFECHDF